jgi:hypothetical protein
VKEALKKKGVKEMMHVGLGGFHETSHKEPKKKTMMKKTRSSDISND